MTCATLPLLIPNDVVPLNVATILCEPSANVVVHAALPEPLTATPVQPAIALPLSVKDTEPPVTGLPPLVTVAVKVMFCVVEAGFIDETTVVEVNAMFSSTVISSDQPPDTVDTPPPSESSMAYSDHVPFAPVPLKTEPSVAVPAGAGELTDDGPGAGKLSFPAGAATRTSVGRYVPLGIVLPEPVGTSAGAASENVRSMPGAVDVRS